MAPNMGECFLCGQIHDNEEARCDYGELRAAAIEFLDKNRLSEAKERLMKRLVGCIIANSLTYPPLDGEGMALVREGDLNALWDTCSSIDMTAMDCRGEEFAKRCRLFNRLLSAALRVFKAPASKESLRERMDGLKQALLPLLTAEDAAKVVLGCGDFFPEEG